MTEIGMNSQYMVIKVNTQTGDMKIGDENGKPPTQVKQKDINEIYPSRNVEWTAKIFHADQSPGCVYINLGGWWLKICR